jgi:hypothetical protein
MMGFGLICLLIAERRKKQSTKVDRGREPRPLVSRLLKNHFLWAIFLMFAGRTTGVMGHNPRWMGGTGCGCASYSTLQTDSSRSGQKLRDANEIVGDRSQDEEPFHQGAPTMPGLAQTSDGLHPPKGFFDPLALDRANAIAGMGWRVEHASIAERRLVLFCETFGVQPR